MNNQSSIEKTLISQLVTTLSERNGILFIQHMKNHFKLLPHSLYQCHNIATIRTWLPVEDSEKVLVVMKMLCKKPTKLFSERFILFDDGFDIFFTKREMDEAEKCGELIHPRTGVAVKNFHEKVYPVWKGTRMLRELLNECS